MKIFLAQSWLGRKEDLLIYPIGLISIATVLEQQGHEVTIFDPNTAAAPLADLVRAVKRFAPDFIGLSLRNIDNQLRLRPVYYYQGMRQTLAVLREVSPDKPIAVGGPGYSIFPDIILERNPAIDFGVYLEAEESLPDLLRNLNTPRAVRGIYYRDADGTVVFSGPRALPDFASLPFPRRHFVDMAPYKQNSLESIGVQTKRGCPLTCAYCVYPHLNGRRWRLRSPKSVVEEIEYLRRDYGVRRITFADSIVNLPYAYSSEIFTLLKEAKLGVEWLGYMHVKGVDRNYLQLCMDAGCTALIFSPDALSRGALEGLRKQIVPQDIAALKHMLDTDPTFARLRVQWCFFVNPPGENLLGLLHLLWFFVRSKQFFRERTRDTFINWIRMEPSSHVYRTALEQGEISPDTDLLPEDESDLHRTFYSAPGLHMLDPLILTMLRVPGFARHLLAQFRSAVRNNEAP